MGNKDATVQNGPRSVWQMRQEYREHVREVAKAELWYLQRAGARGPQHKFLELAAKYAASTSIFRQIADYAEGIMPALQANRANWPEHYQKSDIIETLPRALREMADTRLHEFWQFKRAHPRDPFPFTGAAPLPARR